MTNQLSIHCQQFLHHSPSSCQNPIDPFQRKVNRLKKWTDPKSTEKMSKSSDCPSDNSLYQELPSWFSHRSSNPISSSLLPQACKLIPLIRFFPSTPVLRHTQGCQHTFEWHVISGAVTCVLFYQKSSLQDSKQGAHHAILTHTHTAYTAYTPPKGDRGCLKGVA